MANKKPENMEYDEFVDFVEGLDDDALMETWTEFGSGVAETRRRLLVFSHEHQKRVRLADLEKMGITPSDLELLQEVRPDGIESQESVHEGSDN